MKTAILIDGGFFRKRANNLYGNATPEERINQLISYVQCHLRKSKSDLYKIFYYDCLPIDKEVYHPLTQKNISLKKSAEYAWANEFIARLHKVRKLVVRLGKISEPSAKYVITDKSLKKLLNGSITISQLTDADFRFVADQKGVDMKIGIDITSIALKKQADQIILISGDSDFVPAAKTARREGIDFILDPMWAQIKDELDEHVDGLMSMKINPTASKTPAKKSRKTSRKSKRTTK